MDEIDLKLDAWRQATEDVSPTADTLAHIHKAIDLDRLPTAEGLIPTTASPNTSTGLAISKLSWLIASIVIGVIVAAGVFAWIRSFTPTRVTPSMPFPPAVAPVPSMAVPFEPEDLGIEPAVVDTVAAPEAPGLLLPQQPAFPKLVPPPVPSTNPLTPEPQPK